MMVLTGTAVLLVPNVVLMFRCECSMTATLLILDAVLLLNLAEAGGWRHCSDSSPSHLLPVACHITPVVLMVTIAMKLLLTAVVLVQEVCNLQRQVAGATAQMAALQARLSLSQAKSPGFFARQLAASDNKLPEVLCLSFS